MTQSVPIEVLQEAFKDSGISADELARRMDWMEGRSLERHPDRNRVLRALGLRPHRSGDQKEMHFRKTVRREKADRILDALGAEPSEAPPSKSTVFCDRCGIQMRRKSEDGLCGLCVEEMDVAA